MLYTNKCVQEMNRIDEKNRRYDNTRLAASGMPVVILWEE